MPTEKKSETPKRSSRAADRAPSDEYKARLLELVGHEKETRVIDAVVSISDSLSRIALAQETLVLAAMQSGVSPLLPKSTFLSFMEAAGTHVLSNLRDLRNLPEKSKQEDLLKQATSLREKLEEIELKLKQTAT